ncbi:hypothetical protein HKK55_24175 [Pseudomonas sp. ADAK18]|uniref:hypothetical protein n=1 Tax=Pseudomonas sp. ADAK18 TaxID=2730848 RepID=UPI001462808B|nr:hypothetical protein [Pseudomonas sp. ADAK18]QJI31665.1 hypothetical protein HKK55_24175 [Pseudomonas sp. ADAK18]
MIFGPDPSVILLIGVLMLLAALALVGLLALLAAVLIPRSRRHVLGHPWRYGILTLLALVFVGFGGLMLLEDQRISAQMEQDRQALNPRLEQDLQLGDLHFPAGSQVQLQTLEPLDWQGQPQPHGLQSLKLAEFAQPIEVRGLQVTAIDLMPGYYSSRLRLSQEQTLDGWRCAAGQWVSFNREQETMLQPDRWRFAQCDLATAVRILGIDWPAGTRVMRSSRGWALHAEDDEMLAVDGFRLSYLSLDLDDRRSPKRWDGLLAAPVSFGEWHYPEGTQLRGSVSGVLLFSPSGAGVARNERTGETVTSGRSIQQQRSDGTFLAIKANSEVGVLEWSVLSP